MPVLHIPVGIPGCGKSSLAPVINPNALIVSSDAIREEMGDVYDQSRNDEVFLEFHERIEDFLTAGFDVYADATSLNKFARDKLFGLAVRVSEGYPAGQGVTTHILLFRNLEQAIRRNSLREVPVPGEAMLRMIEKYEQTIQSIYDEGWDHITEISKVS